MNEKEFKLMAEMENLTYKNIKLESKLSTLKSILLEKVKNKNIELSNDEKDVVIKIFEGL
jgi:hypothetical protein